MALGRGMLLPFGSGAGMRSAAWGGVPGRVAVGPAVISVPCEPAGAWGCGRVRGCWSSSMGTPGAHCPRGFAWVTPCYVSVPPSRGCAGLAWPPCTVSLLLLLLLLLILLLLLLLLLLPLLSSSLLSSSWVLCWPGGSPPVHRGLTRPSLATSGAVSSAPGEPPAQEAPGAEEHPRLVLSTLIHFAPKLTWICPRANMGITMFLCELAPISLQPPWVPWQLPVLLGIFPGVWKSCLGESVSSMSLLVPAPSSSQSRGIAGCLWGFIAPVY